MKKKLLLSLSILLVSVFWKNSIAQVELIGELSTKKSQIKDFIKTVDSQENVLFTSSDIFKIPDDYRACYNHPSAPKTIKDLNYGISLEATKIEKDNSGDLSLFGFGNISLGKKETAIVVEFMQYGFQKCDSVNLTYGVGARMLMHVKVRKGNAKVDSPQEVSASIIFNKASAKFSIKTFGIVGPGVASLVRAGTVTENTYPEFIKEIANLISNAYQSEEYTITPHPLFLKNL